MREFLATACLGLGLALSAVAQASGNAALESARAEQERVRALVEAGALPRNALREAERKLEEAADEAVLGRTLYGALELEELTEAQAQEMLGAAERLLERARQRLDRLRRIAEEGALPVRSLEGASEELARRRTTLELARERAGLLKELVTMAQAEAVVAAAEEEGSAGYAELVSRFEGRGVSAAPQIEHIRRAFERRFNRPLPVSANGATAVHRALGFDHRGRVDVALHPDQPEGRWLLALLERLGVPYYAFRSPVPGRSTGAHIHLGPPSTRLRTGD
jgi:hypothetical protein